MLVFSVSAACGQATFNKRLHFDFPAAVMTSVVPTDSCYYTVGILADSVPPYVTGSFFSKIDLAGEPLSTKTLIDPGKTYETWFNSLAWLQDSLFVTVGISHDSIRKTILLGFDQTGDTLFLKEYLNPVYPDFEWILPNGGLGILESGNFIISNLITGGDMPSSDIYVLRTDTTGLIQWGNVYGGGSSETPWSLGVDADGNIVAGGKKANTNLVFEDFASQAMLLKISPSGELLWEYLTPVEIGLRDGANDMVLLADGSIVVASGKGTEIERPTGNTIYFDKHVFRLTPEFEIAWEVTFEDIEPNVSSKLTNIEGLADGSGFVVAGTEGEDTPGSGTYAVRGWLAKVSPDGQPVWTRAYVGIDNDKPRHSVYDLKETPDGGLILCGESKDGTGDTYPSQQGWLLKLDEHGCLIPGCHLTDATGEADLPELELAIYPNPTSDYLNFQLRSVQNAGDASFRILNAQGQLVEQFENHAPSATYIVPVWDWTPGIYFLQYLEGGEVRTSEKFVVSD